MEGKLKILHLEDLPADADLVARELRKGGIDADLLVAGNRAGYERALRDFKPDVILSDHSLPSFDSKGALSVLHEHGLDIPFILITATISEEFAVEIMKMGAADYVLKDRLQRLPLAVTNAVSKQEAERRKQQLHEELVRSERRFRGLIENSNDVVALVDETFKVFYRTPNYENVTGWSQEDLGEQTMIGLVHPDEQPTVRNGMLKVLMNPEFPLHLEFRLRHRDGRYLWMEGVFINKLDDESIRGMISTMRDITDKKLASERLRDSEKRYELVMLATNDVIWDWDVETNRIYRSENYHAFFGYPAGPDQMRDEGWISHIHPEDREYILASLLRAINSSNRVKWEEEYRFYTSTGELLYIRDCGYIIRDDSKRTVRMVGAMQDITNRKKAEQALTRSEEKYRKIAETAQEGIWLIDEHDKTVFVNRKLCEIFGYTAEEMMSKTNFDLMDEESRVSGAEAMERRRNGVKENLDMRYKTKSGKSVWTNVSANPIFDDYGRYIGALAMVTDISERKKTLEKLVKSEKRVREFARHLNRFQEDERARIAREIHDELGQQLVGLKIGLSSLSRHAAGNARLEEKVSQMLKEADQSIHAMRRIATELRPGILDSLGLIPSLQWLSSEFCKRHTLPCTFHADVVRERFEGELSTCFFRICQESLTNVAKHSEATEVSIRVDDHDNRLTLTISDNGKGIATDKLENPFSMGLLGMKERALIIGADLRISDRENGGTTIQLTAKIN